MKNIEISDQKVQDKRVIIVAATQKHFQKYKGNFFLIYLFKLNK